MLFNFIRQRLKLKACKRHNFSMLAIALLMVAILTCGISVFNNAREHALSGYWTKNGNADIISIIDLKNKNLMDDIQDSCEKFAYANVESEPSSVKCNDLSSTAVIVYADIMSVQELFNLDIEAIDFTDKVVLNSKLLGEIGAKIGDTIKIGDRDFIVGDVSNKINFFMQNQPIVIINEISLNASTMCSQKVAFYNLGHDENSIERVENLLSTNIITYINQYDAAKSILSEFNNLENIVFILFFSAFLICFVLAYSSCKISINSNAQYFLTLRTIGMSKKRMVRIITMENLLYSTFGIVIGYFCGLFLAKLICAVTKTSFHFLFINLSMSICVIALGYLVSVLPTVIYSLKNLTGLPIRILKSSKRQGEKIWKIIAHAINLLMGIGILLFVILFNVDNASKTFLMWLNILKICFSILAIIMITVSLLKLIIFLLKRMSAGTLKLSACFLSARASNVFGVSIALIMCLIMAGMCMDMAYSFKSWANHMAERQLTFDMRAEADNNDIGLKSLSNLLENNEVIEQGQYYLDTATVSNTQTYILCETEFSQGKLQDVYSSNISLKTLLHDEVVLSKRLIASLSLSVGDNVIMRFNGLEKSVKIVGEIETQDYSSHLIFVSQKLFQMNNYRKICCNINLNGAISYDELYNNYTGSVLKFQTKEQLSESWRSSATSGVDIIFYITLIILAAMIIMLKNSISNSVWERKGDFAALRIMGMNKAQTFKILFTEISLFQIPIILISLIFSPLAAYYFVNLNAIMIGSQIKYCFDVVSHIVVWGVLIILLFLNPISVFIRAKNESPIETYKNSVLGGE